MNSTIEELTAEYDRALSYTNSLWQDLSQDEVHWRSGSDASAIGWHLGHQAAVAHFMVRNLTAAEPRIDPELDALMDSATPEPERGALPDLSRLATYRESVASRLRVRVQDIARGAVGAPQQLEIVAQHLLIAVINHEYQHDKWIGEVRSEALGKPLPKDPTSDRLTKVDDYLVVLP